MTSRATAAIAATVLLVFGAFSTWVIWRDGYFGFVTLARHDRWALQMLIDLALSLVVANAWVLADARRRGIAAWPFVVASVGVGSIAVLAYMVRRAFAADLSAGVTDARAATRTPRASVG